MSVALGSSGPLSLPRPSIQSRLFAILQITLLTLICSRARKTKCDGQRPQCGHCTNRRAQCTWPGPNPSQEPQLLSPRAPSTPDQPFPDIVSSIGSYTQSPAAISDDQVQRGLQLCLELFFERHFVPDFCSFAYRPEFEQECRQHGALSAAVVALCGRYLDMSDCQSCFGLPSPRHVSRHYTQKARLLAKAKSDQPSGTYRSFGLHFTSDLR